MLYSSGIGNNSPGARWDIWPSKSIPALSRALDPKACQVSCELAQPIIAETHYAGPDVMEKVVQATGTPHWTINQLPGEAVVIPPGCPHQVPSSSLVHFHF
jgi:hypothetical protein